MAKRSAVKDAGTVRGSNETALRSYTLTKDDAVKINTHRGQVHAGPDAVEGDVHPAIKTGETVTQLHADGDATKPLVETVLEHLTVFLIGHVHYVGVAKA